MKKKSSLVLLFIAIIMVTVVLPVQAAYDTTTLNNAISYKGIDLNDPIDGMWQGFMEDNDNKGSVKSNQNGISGDGNSIKLEGYQSGGNVQYAYQNTDETHNKIIKFKMIFDGELVSPDGSFITFVFRSSGFSSKFYWDQPCYAILIKGGKVEAQKFPAFKSSVPNNLGGTKGKTPIIKPLEKPFTPGTYDIEVGALDGISPATKKNAVNLILKINGQEILNIWDDSERTPTLTQKGYFMISLCATQKDIDGDHSSRSSITIMKVSDQANSTSAPAEESTTAQAGTDSDEEQDTTTAEASTQEAVDNSAAAATVSENTDDAAEAVESQEKASPTPETSSTDTDDSTAVTNVETSAEATTDTETSDAVAASTEVDSNKTVSSNSLIWIIGVIIVITALGGGLYFLLKRKK